ncbi:MAG: ABC transporter ATP-binding protein, partial [Actinobacteria bacterium]|nr:ABC transporter ATP-binding protein [Actinomycetota bacterium]
LLVDELSMGLAPRAARGALEAIAALAADGTGVLLAEQHPGLALEVADRAVVLAQGRTVFEGRAPDLAAQPELLRAAYLGG